MHKSEKFCVVECREIHRFKKKKKRNDDGHRIQNSKPLQIFDMHFTLNVHVTMTNGHHHSRNVFNSSVDDIMNSNRFLIDFVDTLVFPYLMLDFITRSHVIIISNALLFAMLIQCIHCSMFSNEICKLCFI